MAQERRLHGIVATAAIVLGLAAGGLRAQSDEGVRETALLREAAAMEGRGAFGDAERLLRAILDRNPASLGAVLQLERVLVIQGRAEALIPVTEKLLEEDPASVIVHQVAVRALALLDRKDALEAAGERWIAAMPHLEIPYRELARIHRQRGELETAIGILERGRVRVARADALALELGDAYVDAGLANLAIEEWDRAVGRDGSGFLAVHRRLRTLPDGGASLIPRLVGMLAAKTGALARQRAAAILAIDAGMAREAEAIARRIAPGMGERERRAFLLDIARRADGAGLAGPAYWAYGELVALSGDREDGTQVLRMRMAQLALVRGDTGRAIEVYHDLERGSHAGSPAWRQSRALRIRVAIDEGDTDRAHAELLRFRTEDPAAVELDASAAAVAGAHLDRGDVDRAVDAIAGLDGAGVRLVRARIHLQAGDVGRARGELLSAAPLLHGTEATEAIALASVFGRLSSDGAALVGRAASRGSDPAARAGALERLLEDSRRLGPRDRAAVLEYAVGFAERARLDSQAEAVRRELIEFYPSSPEAPGALFALALSLERRGEPVEEVRVLLGKLIMDYPRSALVPQARRALDRLQTR